MDKTKQDTFYYECILYNHNNNKIKIDQRIWTYCCYESFIANRVFQMKRFPSLINKNYTIKLIINNKGLNRSWCINSFSGLNMSIFKLNHF